MNVAQELEPEGGGPRPARPILVVDDEAHFARAICKHLGKHGFECREANRVETAKSLLGEGRPAAVLLDMRLPDGSGLDLLREIRERWNAPQVPVVVMTAYSEVDDAVEAMKLQATDYLRKPLDLEQIQDALKDLVGGPPKPSKKGRSADSSPVPDDGMIGQSPAMKGVRERIERLARVVASAKDIPPTILIHGETGTGKEVAAQALHERSARHDQPFVPVDCGALPNDLVEAELFGHEKGAYTHAQERRAGLIESAGAGTVLLDEVGELPLETQTKLLAMLGRRTMRRLGSNQQVPIRCWVLAATNRDLREEVEAGRFRSDLYYRLSELQLQLPPLRERMTDIPLLAQAFAAETAADFDLPEPRMDPETLEILQGYQWPGNIRELRHVIRQAVLLGTEGVLRPGDLELDGGGEEDSAAIPETGETLRLRDVEMNLVRRALERAGGNVSQAARLLGISRTSLRYRLEKYHIKP
ncbi:sigma-54-dependent transcriptional regulator [Thiohalorhabdus sp. Cl-TMA]|uniref:Sigma-54-dependent transcriptional regulator n=1 Tax=Thiohalorhabdus methylotrophus TaxID=3242694 RepID=A0ABV4TUU7_9GAMM